MNASVNTFAKKQNIFLVSGKKAFTMNFFNSIQNNKPFWRLLTFFLFYERELH